MRIKIILVTVICIVLLCGCNSYPPPSEHELYPVFKYDDFKEMVYTKYTIINDMKMQIREPWKSVFYIYVNENYNEDEIYNICEEVKSFYRENIFPFYALDCYISIYTVNNTLCLKTYMTTYNDRDEDSIDWEQLNVQAK